MRLDNLFFDRVLPVIGWSVVAAWALLLVYGVFALTPVSILTEKRCLERGYPEYKVAYDLSGYCMNLDGSVTVKVEKQ